MAKQAEERTLHEAKLTKMEAEMKTVFQQKVQEKESKLKQSEEELYARHREMKDALEKQRAELEDKKRRIEQGRPLTPEKSSVRPALSPFGIALALDRGPSRLTLRLLRSRVHLIRPCRQTRSASASASSHLPPVRSPHLLPLHIPPGHPFPFLYDTLLMFSPRSSPFLSEAHRKRQAIKRLLHLHLTLSPPFSPPVLVLPQTLPDLFAIDSPIPSDRIGFNVAEVGAMTGLRFGRRAKGGSKVRSNRAVLSLQPPGAP